VNAWLQRLTTKTRRAISTKVARRAVAMLNEEPLISFTFDDFPQSALREGGAILLNHGARGTFFASLGLMGRIGPSGELFHWRDIDQVLGHEHELACHTYDHCHAWETSVSDFEASLLRNQRALQQHLPGASFRSFSYPSSCPRPAIKRLMSDRYDCCRGGGQTFNAGSVDLNFAKACFLERCDFDSISALIESNNRARGWLIFVTHDVCKRPTRFGCTPALFERVVRQANNSGARLVTVQEGVKKIRGGDRSMLPSASTSECHGVGSML
jgi:peptidoglycan/xylan/chitin deacetylase (PgdA/CDA1 family)